MNHALLRLDEQEKEMQGVGRHGLPASIRVHRTKRQGNYVLMLIMWIPIDQYVARQCVNINVLVIGRQADADSIIVGI